MVFRKPAGYFISLTIKRKKQLRFHKHAEINWSVGKRNFIYLFILFYFFIYLFFFFFFFHFYQKSTGSGLLFYETMGILLRVGALLFFNFAFLLIKIAKSGV